jgi:two-component system LytT family response regulator
MLKALIVDDEEKARDLLAFLIETYIPEITDCRVAADGSTALSMIPDFQPDLLFLDVQMPRMSGFELLNTLQRWQFDVIFTTAHHQFALQAIKFSALDYLLKPVDADELQVAVARHIAKKQNGRFSKPPQIRQVENLLQNLESATSPKNQKIAIHTTDGTYFLKIQEIVRLEADRVYTHFYLRDNRHHVASKPLREYEELLVDHGFCRVHKSHLVNLAFAEYYEAEGNLMLTNGGRVEVARRRKDEVLAAMKK